MKRCWFGAGLLIVLLAASLGVTLGMDKIHEPIAADLKQAAECAELGDWHNAEEFSRRAEDAWNKWEHFRACFADHTPMEEIDALFAQVEVYAAAREEAEFAAGCAELSRRMEAMANAHGAQWWNVL